MQRTMVEGADWTLHPWRHSLSNVGGVTAVQARHNSSHCVGVTAGQVRHNSSIFIIILYDSQSCIFDSSW